MDDVVLATGGAGFTRSYLTRRLTRAGHRVVEYTVLDIANGRGQLGYTPEFEDIRLGAAHDREFVEVECSW